MQRERGTQLVRDPDAQLKQGERGGTLGEVSVRGARSHSGLQASLRGLAFIQYTVETHLKENEVM